VRIMTGKLVVSPGSNVVAIDPVQVTYPKPWMDTGNFESDRLLVEWPPVMGILVLDWMDGIEYHCLDWDDIPRDPVEIFNRLVSYGVGDDEYVPSRAVTRILSNIWHLRGVDSVYLFHYRVNLEWRDIEPAMLAWREGKQPPLYDGREPKERMFRVRVSRPFWMTGDIEVGARSIYEAERRALRNIDDIEMKLGDAVEDSGLEEAFVECELSCECDGHELDGYECPKCGRKHELEVDDVSK